MLNQNQLNSLQLCKNRKIAKIEKNNFACEKEVSVKIRI